MDCLKILRYSDHHGQGFLLCYRTILIIRCAGSRNIGEGRKMNISSDCDV